MKKAWICFFVAAAASAQNNRSFVSISGNDANACTATTECRSFNRALSVTNPGGEVIATTSGGYGAAVIAKAVTLTAAPGAYVAITDPGLGIAVIPAATDRVVIRGIHITVTGSGGTGISAIGYGSLHIENCDVTGGAHGVDIMGTTLPAIVSDTVVRGFTSAGFQVKGHATLLRCRAERGDLSTGLFAYVGNVDTVVSAVDFVSVGNEIGAAAVNTIAGHVELNLDRAVLSDNTEDGLEAVAIGDGTVIVRISNSMVVNNAAWGLNQSGTSTLASMNNNFVAGNGTADTIGMISTIPVH
jgi:hypothetical protein